MGSLCQNFKMYVRLILLFLCYIEPNFTASLQRDEVICINNYKCLRKNQIENPNKLDKICRNFESPYCYCCGGTKNYVEHGTICRRFCAIEIINGKATKPCSLANEIEAHDDSVDASEPYPVRIPLVPMSQITCKGQPDPEPESTTEKEQLITPINQFRYGIDDIIE